MKPQESFIAQPIRDLQTMLRVIGKDRKLPELLIPDGIYGEKTMDQVADFQKQAGLSPTGKADLPTWEAIVEAYLPARISQIPAYPLHILLDAGKTIEKGERNPHIYLIQAMLEVLAREYGSICHPGFSGKLDADTSASILCFQKLCGLKPTGTLNKETWKHLALQYPLAASLDGHQTGKNCT